MYHDAKPWLQELCQNRSSFRNFAKDVGTKIIYICLCIVYQNNISIHIHLQICNNNRLEHHFVYSILVKKWKDRRVYDFSNNQVKGFKCTHLSEMGMWIEDVPSIQIIRHGSDPWLSPIQFNQHPTSNSESQWTWHVFVDTSWTENILTLIKYNGALGRTCIDPFQIFD